jgi:hypothetical protein
MINNESTSKDRGEYGGDAHADEPGDYDRESSREEYKGGYDPGFLAGGDGYHRTGKDRDEHGGDAHAGEQGGYDRESSREEYKGGYDPGFLAG